MRIFFCYFILFFGSAIISKFVFLLLLLSSSQIGFSSLHLYGLLWGLRLDATAVAISGMVPMLMYLFACILKSRKLIASIRLIVILACSWLVFSTAADSIYFREASRHVTYEVFTIEGSEWGLLATAFQSYLWYVIVAVLLITLISRLSFWIPLSVNNFEETSKIQIVICFVGWLIFSITAIRGGWLDVPQSPMHAFKLGNPEAAQIAWSAPYSIAYYLIRGKNNAAKYQTQKPSKEQSEKWLEGGNYELEVQSIPRRINTILVLLESWSRVDMKIMDDHKEVTPVFNKLLKNSLSTRAMYCDGHRTFEGMFSVFCSYPNPIGGGVAGTQLQNAKYQCLPEILRKQGWETIFIQGSNRGKTGAFAQTLGFVHSYGFRDIPSGSEKNSWGYMDDSIYDFALDKMKKSSKPFFVTINTGSTHGEFIPEDRIYAFGKDSREQIRRSVLHDADRALGHFIDSLKEQMTLPTLVVLVADHSAGICRNCLAKYSIPFQMFELNSAQYSEMKDVSASQRDIAPTILDWLEGPQIPWFTGASLLSPDYNGLANFSKGNETTYIRDDKLVVLNVETLTPTFCGKVDSEEISVEPMWCGEDAFINLVNETKLFTQHAQFLLFEGKTTWYRKVDYNQTINTFLD